ncbi:PAS domain S-box-containing protein/diguanylate cyclase (GGDEF) domain-containing protein [Marinobacter sp. LV10R510-11A]|uniref:EAL domain-containing protein n=1 Tax=Marinobacter sp. LV10R510-11A TaxID=1415568 RepID=UPI000BB6B54E|nr:EAL domain-containing protein [Marinobacter sp. LV10R510-11A]SOB77853.1 PAS domain S-box-containing protein/diguanylate cyclase (GGDEF) domain-containing protein [Marinobacter sp. LV10R510-11A]
MTEPTLRVLLIEDDEDDYIITKDLLAEVSPVATRLIWRDCLEDGLTTLHENAVDVALVDFRFGPDSGLDLIRRARAEGITTPFILLTGQGDDELDACAVELGAADYLVKGRVDGYTLLRSIRYAIDRATATEKLAISEAQYRMLFENNPTPMCLAGRESSRINAMNAAARKLYGFSEEEISGMTMADLRGNTAGPSPDGEGLILQPGASLEHHETKNSQSLTVEVMSESITIHRDQLLLLTLCDRTAQIKNSRQLKLLERCIESSSNGIVVTDARTSDMPVVYVNPTFERMTGYSADEILGKNCRFLQGGEYDLSNEDALTEIRKSIANSSDVSVVLRNYRKDGSPFWNDLYLSPTRNDSGEITHWVGIQNDISERKSIEHQLAYNTTHDVVTQLPNRALLEDRLTQNCQFALRYNRHVGVLFIDLDGFKRINDSLGHRTGDQILVEVARRLGELVQSSDTVARVSGDGFVIALSDLAQGEDAQIKVEQVIEALSRPYRIGNENLHLTASIGIAITDGDICNPTELIQQAGLALDQAKQLGHNTWQWFSKEMNAQANYRVKLRNQLQDAIDNEALTLFYQPLIDARTGQTKSIEALVRWQHPEQGLIPPGDFIPLAEETGQIIALGRWVLQQACRDMTRLHALGFRDCSIAVNVSPAQIRKDDFIDTVEKALQASGLQPQDLELEVVESAILYDTDKVITTLQELRNMGVSIAIDDFGTGYSSLSYIKLMPANRLKIDLLFIKEVIQNRRDAAITQGVISMAHHLSLEVVAEGVETEAQAAFLRRNNCDLLQGYLFSRPIPFDQLVNFMENSDTRSQTTHQTHENKQKTLLLLDDDANILKALKRTLRRDNYHILSTTKVSEAFSMLAENDVEVIISDQRMPEMSGTEFFSQVKAIYPNTVRIVLSGYTDLKSVTDAINQGSIYKFLTKPWEDSHIREHVHQAFKYHAAVQVR